MADTGAPSASLTDAELERLEGQWRGEWRNEITGFAVADIRRLLAEVRRLKVRAECPYEAGCPAHGPQEPA